MATGQRALPRPMPPSRPVAAVRRRLTAALLITSLFVPPAAAQYKPTGDDPTGTMSRVVPEYPARSVATSTAPIFMPGGGAVTDGGAARYDLPLWVPDGPQGMQPALDIGYRGGRANGHLGVGFGLGGLSIIAPCAKSFASEGYADGLDFGVAEFADLNLPEDGDSYCLDGKKLVAYTDSEFTTGSPHTTYHTELESHEQIIAYRSGSTLPPDKFHVHARDGKLRVYIPLLAPQLENESANTRVVSDRTVPFIYLLQEVRDRHGNKIVYTYEHDDALNPLELAYRIGRIDYSFSEGITSRRQLRFLYETRSDLLVRYVRGVKVVTRSRLARIDAIAPNPTDPTRVWSYYLSYAESKITGRSLLSSVRLRDQGDAYSWTRSFDWTDRELAVDDRTINEVEFGPAAFGYDEDTLTWYNSRGYEHENWLRANDTRVLLYDIDGDGDDDALYRTAPSGVEPKYWIDGSYNGLKVRRGTIKVRVSSETEPLEQRLLDVSDELEPNLANLYLFTFSSQQSAAYAHLGKSRIGDLDGDGRMDLMLARTKIQETGSRDVPQLPNDPSEPQQYIDDWWYGFTTYAGGPFDHFAGNPFSGGNPELDTVNLKGPVLRADNYVGGDSFLIVQPSFQRVLADFDGDGRTEVLDPLHGDQYDVRDPGDWNEPQYAGHPYRTELSTDPAGTVTNFGHHWTCGNDRALVIDVDGDGRHDALMAGGPYAEVGETDPLTGGGTYRRLTITDPMWGAGGQRYGTTRDTSRLWGGDCSSNEVPDLVMGDWNGDGLADALYPPGSVPEKLSDGQTGYNVVPYVRWNLGTGFGPLEVMPVEGAPSLTALMEQKVPTGKLGSKVAWDRGTRVADVDGDGRSDIIAVRQDNAVCVDTLLALGGSPQTWGCLNRVMVYRSRGTHFVGEEIHSWPDGMATLTHGFTTAQVGDVDGDGSPDLVHVAGGKLQMLEMPWREAPDLLARVRDSSAAYPLETFEYTRSWWGEEPRTEATTADPTGPAVCAWPIRCSRSGTSVVGSHRVFAGSKPDGTPMYRTQLHRYTGLRRSLIGRGSLGFERHEVWDRERGRAVSSSFDNETLLDANGPAPGAIFHPYVGHPHFTTEYTPRIPVPTAAEIASGSLSPGLVPFMQVDVRTRWTSSTYELRPAADGRVLSVLPARSEVDDVENTIQANVDAPFPEYGVGSPVGTGRHTTTTATYDDDGNVEEQTTEIGSSWGPLVTRKVKATYDRDVGLDTWHLGLATYVATQSYDTNDTVKPTRVTRTTYDTMGAAKTIDARATGPAYDMCLIAGASPEACEVETTSTIVEERDDFGNPTSIQVSGVASAIPRTSTVEWDAEGVYSTRTRDPLGFETTTLIHPALGVPVLAMDIVGTTSTAIYDGFGRLRSASRPGTPLLTRSYVEYNSSNRRGLTITDVSADGSQSYRRTDELGRMIETGERGFAQVWSHGAHEYDAFGNLVRSSRPSTSWPPAAWTVADFDRLGQEIARTTPDHHTTLFEHGILDTVTRDPSGHTTYVTRDPAGRTIESGHELDGGEKYGEVTFAYAAFDHPERVYDADGNTTGMSYDPFGRLVVANDPDTGMTTYRYDGFGQTIGEDRANGDTYVRSFDALGRLAEVDGPDGITSRTYDVGTGAAGKLTRLEGSEGVVTSLTYDSLGRTRSVAQTVEGVTDSVYHRYDDFSRLKYQFYPSVTGFARFTVAYVWGSDGFLRQLQDASSCNLSPTGGLEPVGCVAPALWTVQGRDPAFQLTQAKLGTTNMLETREYHADSGRIRKISAPGMATRYEYNSDGQLSARIEDDQTGRVEAFAYDDLHRLETWRLTTPYDKDKVQKDIRTRYAYDELGNLLSAKIDGGATVFSGNYASEQPHALTSSSIGGTYGYDKIGRQISGDNRTIDYNSFDLPVSVNTGLAVRNFTHDGDGRRVLREDAAQSIRYFGRLFEHRARRTGTSLDTFYVYGDDRVVAQVDYNKPAGTKETRFVVSDPLGSASVVLNTNYTVDERTYFDPFGARINGDGTAATDPDTSTSRGFTGHEEDGNGLVNMQGRIYDRRQFRFLTPDPVIAKPLFGQSYNPYSYVHNNPLNLVDPSGFQAEDSAGSQQSSPEGGRVTGTDEDGHGVIEVDLTEIHGDQRPVATDGPRFSIPDVVELQPFVLRTPVSDRLEQAARTVFDPKDPVVDFAFRTMVATGHPSTMLEHTAKLLVAAIQAPAISAISAGQHHARAGLLEEAGADEAVLDEQMEAAQHGMLGIADAAGLVTFVVLPAGRMRGYSAAFEAKLSTSSYPGLSREQHFREANEQFLRAVETNPELARLAREVGIQLKRTATGLAPRKPPSGWTWHHELDEGSMVLVPRPQHSFGSGHWFALHPKFYGGYFKWGR